MCPVVFLLGQHRPGDARLLVGQCDRGNSWFLVRQEVRDPGVLLGMGTGLLQDGKRSHDQDALQVAVTLLGYRSQPRLAAGGILARDDADPGPKVAPRLEYRSIGNRGNNGARADEANARNGLKPFAVIASAMLRAKPLLDRRDLRLAGGNLRN